MIERLKQARALQAKKLCGIIADVRDAKKACDRAQENHQNLVEEQHGAQETVAAYDEVIRQSERTL